MGLAVAITSSFSRGPCRDIAEYRSSGGVGRSQCPFSHRPDLLADLSSDYPHVRRRKLTYYGRPALLCIDEVGYLSYDSSAADLLYEVINRRYERASLLITTNRAFKDWDSVFPNAACIATF